MITRTFFGDLLRRIRADRGWTQRRLAQEVGVKRPSVTLWESGEFVPDSKYLPALSGLSGFPEKDLAHLRVAVKLLEQGIDPHAFAKWVAKFRPPKQ